MKQQFRAVSFASVGRLTAPFFIMAASLWMLAGMIDVALLSSVPKTIATLPIGMFFLAAVFCALSLWAVARYDGLAHRHFQTGISDTLARKSGFAAIAIAQTVGFGVVTGAAVRWRMLPHIGLASAMQLSVFVSITFMTALAFLAALACLILPAPVWTTLPAMMIFAGLPLVVLMLSFAPVFAPLRHRVQIPSLRAIRAILGWSGLDLLAAAAALYLLIPLPELSFFAFLPVFLLALGAAMASGAPGGVGPFELALVALLPQVPSADLICAIVVFRTLYFAIPAMLGVVVVFGTPRPKRPTKPAPLRQTGTDGQLAEHGILAQTTAALHHGTTASFALWTTAQTSTMLFDPVQGCAKSALANLKAQADATTRTACIYKCSPRTALMARDQGWCVARTAYDCLIDLATYDLAAPARRGLRRKLRKAEKSGVVVFHSQSLPLKEMAAIDATWQAIQGSARGGTMGRFCPDYLQGQDVYLAYKNDTLIAFASFHRDPKTPCLDLMRHGAELPDGTMHLLVQTAIKTAHENGRSGVNLAAIPALPSWTKRITRFSRCFDNPGLRQFKSGFAPRYAPRYAAAPCATALVTALADITAEVHYPRPLAHRPKPHKQDEEYEIAFNT